MKISNFSNTHGLATIRGWTKGTSTTGGSVSVTDGTTTVSPASTITVAAVTDGGGGNAELLPQITGSSGSGVFDTTAGRPRVLYPDQTTPTDGLDVDPGSVQLFSQHTPGSLADAGLDLEAGDDYVGIRISEKDASTVQIYPDVAGGYDVEFVERTAGHFRFIAVAGGVAMPALGHFPQYSAAPGSPTEGDGYYDTTTHIAYIYNGTTWKALF